MDVVVLGHIIIETIVFPDKRVAAPVLGSPAAYSAAILSKLKNKTGLCTKVGTDIPAEFIEIFEKVGVDLTGLSVAGKYSTRNKLIYSAPESKHLEYLRKAPKVRLSDLPESYKKAKIVYICPMDYEVELDTIKELKRRGKKVVVDLGGYGGATSATHPRGEGNDLQLTKEVIRNCEIVKTSLEDCQYIFGEQGNSSPKNHYVNLMRKIGARNIVLTMGEKGVLYANPDLEKKFPALRCKVIDTTGAGDAFAAGMIHKYLRSTSIHDAIKFGQATACCLIERTGGVVPERIPAEDEVLLKMNESKNFKK